MPKKNTEKFNMLINKVRQTSLFLVSVVQWCLMVPLATTAATLDPSYYQPTQILNSRPLGITLEWPNRVGLVPQPRAAQPVHVQTYYPANYHKRSDIPMPTSAEWLKLQPQVAVPVAVVAEASDSHELTTSSPILPSADEQDFNATLISETDRLVLLRQKMIASQSRGNVSIEDTNWKIAAECLSAKFGAQLMSNKDVKCAASQVVLSISRMHRVSCQSCELYFHCEGFSKALKRCNDNYDVQQTLEVLRGCQGLVDADLESTQATKFTQDCQREYLCSKDCKYNPVDGTCPRNTCSRGNLATSFSYNSFNSKLQRADQLADRRTKPDKAAFPAGSPIRQMMTDSIKRN